MTINFETATYNEVREANCPHCGIHLSNGLLTVDDEMANSTRTYYEAQDQSFCDGEYECMGCGGHFGKKVTYEPKGTGIKIQKDRPTRNGITRPSVGGKCDEIWVALDGYLQETGEMPTAKGLHHAATESGWNWNNATSEFYRWKKFNA